MQAVRALQEEMMLALASVVFQRLWLPFIAAVAEPLLTVAGKQNELMSQSVERIAVETFET